MPQLKQKVLFVCIHNSARSQMAEAFLNQMGHDYFEAESAGIEPGKLNALVIESMQEIGIDISHKSTKSVFDIYKSGKQYDAVITVCDAEAAEKCPVFQGKVKRMAWSFSDPSSFKGTHEEKLAATRLVRDQVKASVAEFIEQNKNLTISE